MFELFDAVWGTNCESSILLCQSIRAERTPCWARFASSL
jgi:hypothetical protein